MAGYILNRLFMSLATLFFIILLTFSMMHAIPGGPFTLEKDVPPAVIEALEAKYHLDDPLPVQFLDYLKGLLTFDLGPSFKYYGKTVNSFIESGFPYSGSLGVITIVIVLLAAIPMGVAAALNNGKWIDALLMGIATIGITIPSFVVASGLMYIFAFKLNWAPTFGVDSARGYILPVAALSGYSLSFIARLTRSSLLDVMGQDYIRTARAKGLSETRVILKHALRNALIPVITVLGPTIAGLLTGSFVIEKIFAIPGLGSHFVYSIGQRDYTVIMGMTVFYSVFLVSMVFLVDIFYRLVDPRINFD
jgi:oligopeptide transport system permease protein